MDREDLEEKSGSTGAAPDNKYVAGVDMAAPEGDHVVALLPTGVVDSQGEFIARNVRVGDVVGDIALVPTKRLKAGLEVTLGLSNEAAASFKKMADELGDAVENMKRQIAEKLSVPSELWTTGGGEVWRSVPGDIPWTVFTGTPKPILNPHHPTPEATSLWIKAMQNYVSRWRHSALARLRSNHGTQIWDKETAVARAQRFGELLGVGPVEVETYPSPRALVQAVEKKPYNLTDWQRFLETDTDTLKHAINSFPQTTDSVSSAMFSVTQSVYRYLREFVKDFVPSFRGGPHLGQWSSFSLTGAMMPRWVLFPNVDFAALFAFGPDTIPHNAAAVAALRELAPYIECIAVQGHRVMISWHGIAKFDDRLRLHSVDTPAYMWENGDGLYAYKGISMPPDAYREENRTARYAFSRTNLEQRRAVIEMMGIEKYIKECGFTVVDEHPKFGRLLCDRVTENALIFGRKEPQTEVPAPYTLADIHGGTPTMILEVNNSTPEPDGTFKKYYIEVPNTMRTAHEAAAWTFGLPPELYSPEFES